MRLGAWSAVGRGPVFPPTTRLHSRAKWPWLSFVGRQGQWISSFDTLTPTMYVQVRTIDGKKNVTVTISKLTTVHEFKGIVEKELDVKVDKQRLFYRGKQLEDEYKLFDYNINVNDVIQLMVKVDPLPEPPKEENKQADEPSKLCKNEEKPYAIEEEGPPCESEYFKIGDYVDVKDFRYGAWFEAKVIGIYKDLNKVDTQLEENDDGLLYKVAFRLYDNEGTISVSLKDIRPIARTTIHSSDVKVGDLIMVNYNIEEPKDRGYWYDMEVKTIVENNRKKLTIKGTLLVGTENTRLDDSIVAFVDEIMKIEELKKISERSEDELMLMQTDVKQKRKHAPFCTSCGDNVRKKCKECGCAHCGKKNDPGKQIVCDECDMSYHIWCLNPPLSAVPDVDEWYCAECKNDDTEIVKAGEKLKESKKKAKMASANSNTTRDWGKGMACVGRTKECTLVPPNHFGEIPGIEVGTIWKFRVQVSEAGVHRPHVAGIHGRESDGAYSIVLSGGYEDDIDNGEEFMYTGSGGRDLSGNKRTAEQSCDQTLTRMNKALAMNCNIPLDAKKGAEAKNWKGGKPVRVVRNFKLSKHSKYAPEEGNRYDGIYKVVKYYPEKGKSGFQVWRYLLRRDDPSPAPWTKEGKKRIASLGLEIMYPEGYLAAMENKDKENKPENKLKRYLTKDLSKEPSLKKQKVVAYKLETGIKDNITKDAQNRKHWQSLMEFLSYGKKVFLEKTEEQFMCICCQELVHVPITTPCGHNICSMCLKRSFSAEVFSCPACREDLGKKFEMVENTTLQDILSALFPGYTAAR
ncbi:E3 ubiquitin-protein ligase UHRF1-like [Cimex lectularius]|uniref:RING-type E3 ubiquitin transferase n=1 Tax=Cimex lectularius TaxID=79782 RepID=A0A8I6RJ04_CIMLE|nr:E3 ubiquitin-protein ligase UHRF1-like [Cimex lectularius]